MNRFRFRLETVLKLRAAREDEKNRELAAALVQLNQEEQRYRKLVDSLNDLDRIRAERGNGRISARQLMQRLFFSRHLQKKCDEQKTNVCQAEAVVQEKRREVVEAMKKRKTLERLRERKRLQYEAEVLHQEQNQLDEAGLQRFSAERHLV